MAWSHTDNFSWNITSFTTGCSNWAYKLTSTINSSSLAVSNMSSTYILPVKRQLLYEESLKIITLWSLYIMSCSGSNMYMNEFLYLLWTFNPLEYVILVFCKFSLPVLDSIVSCLHRKGKISRQVNQSGFENVYNYYQTNRQCIV